MAAAAQPKPKIPFRFGTVRRRLNIGSYPITMGQAIPTIQLPQVGMLSRILVTITGTYTGANANLVIASLDGYDAILARAQLTLNNGSATVIDLSGIGVNQVNLGLNPSLPVKSGLLLTQAAQSFTYKFILPVNANNRRQFEMGLINLQAPEIRATLNLSFNPLSSLFTVAANATLFTAQCNVAYEYFSIPDPTVYQAPALSLVRTIEEAPQLITATGQQLYQIPRLGTMFEYGAVLVLGSKYVSAASNLTEFAIRYNKSDVQYDMLINEEQTYEAEIWGVGAGGPTGGVLNTSGVSLSLWSAGDRPYNGGDFRDAIDTEENTTTESLITVSGSASLATPTNALYHVRRIVQRIVQAQGPTN